METNEEQVVRNIKAIQKRYGISDIDISKELKVTERTYINIKNHPFSYSINRLNDLAKIIGCNINEFFLPLKFTKSEEK